MLVWVMGPCAGLRVIHGLLCLAQIRARYHCTKAIKRMCWGGHRGINAASQPPDTDMYIQSNI